MTDHVTPNGVLETQFITNKRNEKLFARYWTPVDTQPIRALLFIGHGFTEHLGKFDDLVSRFNAMGLFVFGHDHIGHGRSDGVRCHVASYDHYIDDVMQHCDVIKQKYQQLPLFIVGFSMGGMIAIRCALMRPQLFTGVVLLSPLICVKRFRLWKCLLSVAKCVDNLLPYMKVGADNPDNLGHDTERVKCYFDDPLRYAGGPRLKWAVATRQAIDLLDKQVPDIQFPFLLLFGDRDQICLPAASSKLFNRASSTDKTIKVFADMFHGLLYELPETRNETLECIVDWVKDRLP